MAWRISQCQTVKVVMVMAHIVLDASRGDGTLAFYCLALVQGLVVIIKILNLVNQNNW